MWFYALHLEQNRLELSESVRDRILEREWIGMLVRLDDIFNACTKDELKIRMQLRDCENDIARKQLIGTVLVSLENNPLVRNHVKKIVDAHDELAVEVLKHIAMPMEYLVPDNATDQLALKKRLRLLQEIEFISGLDIDRLAPRMDLVGSGAAVTAAGRAFLMENQDPQQKACSENKITEAPEA